MKSAYIVFDYWNRRKQMGTYAMKRAAAGAHLPTPWLFGVLVFTLEWSGANSGANSGEGSAK